MLDFGKNTIFILSAYGVTLTVIAALVLRALMRPKP